MTLLVIDQKVAVAVILGAAMVLFVWGRWRHDVVAIAALAAAVLAGVVKPEDAFKGFADPAVVTVALVLVLSAAVRQSGVLDRVLRRLGPVVDSPHLQLLVLVGFVTLLSAFMNNVGALAIMMPLALAAAERTGRSPSAVLMPLAFGSLLGGLITLIGTPPNLLISSVRQQAVGQPFGMFDFAPVGLAIAAAGIAYLVVASRLLPTDRRGAPSPEQRFQIADFITEARVAAGSKAVGMSIATLEELADGDLTVLAVSSNGRTHQSPQKSWLLDASDIVVMEADSAVLRSVVDQAGLELIGDKELSEEYLKSNEIGTVEVVVAANSDLIGQSSGSLRLRDMGINLLAMSRQGRRRTRRLARERFREGDVLALHGDLDHLAFTIKELGLLPLAERRIELGRRSSVLLPVAIMGGAVVLATTGLLPIAGAFLTGVVALAILRVMRPDEMYAAIDPSIIVLMAALIPVTDAVQSTGGTQDIARFIAGIGAGWSPLAMLAVVLVSTILITPVLNNAATVLLMGPIAVGLGNSAGMSVDALLMAVAIGASCDFLTPFGHQSNTLVMGPGGYRFLDYTRFGLPLTVLVVVVALVVLPVVWPLAK